MPLLLPGILFLAFYTAALMLAPSVRQHLQQAQPDWQYLLPFFVWLAVSLVMQRRINRGMTNADPWVFPIVAVLSGWGVLTIWRLSPSLGAKQIMWYSFGCALMLIALNRRDFIGNLRRYKYLWLFLGLLLIGLTFFIGVNPADAGPKLWLRFFNFYLQPSEPLKLLMIIYLAAYFADQIRPQLSLMQTILPSLLLIILAGLLLVAQRDLGTASLFVALYALMLTVTTQRRRFIFILPGLGLLLAVAAYFASDLVRTRIDIWLNPWLETSGASYQLVQAQIAIAAGGLAGTGPGLGSPAFVPVAVSDFIFSAIAEEGGLLFTSAYMLLILILAIRGLSIAQNSKTSFGRYLAFGISAYYSLQSLFIIGGNLSLLPLTGVTMPFMSYGGSSLVTNLIAALLLLRISTEPSAFTLYEKGRKSYRWVAGAFILLFGVVLAANTALAYFRQRDLLARPENPRWAVYDRFSPRGQIFAQDGEILAATKGSSGAYTRQVVYPPLSNVIGYASPIYGQTGLETSLYDVLRGYAGTDYKELWWHERFFNQPLPGLDIRLNLDLILQQHADGLLNGHKGAIVLLNAATGEVYVLSTYPSFDANRLDGNWPELMARVDAPLLSRPTQGLYPLGSVGGLIALADQFTRLEPSQNLPEINNILDNDCRQAMAASARNDSRLALKYGCLDAVRGLVQADDPAAILEQARALGLFTAPGVAIQTAAPSQPADPSLDPAGFAQALADTKLSPLQLALMAAAVSNNGQLPSAQLVNAYRDPAGNWRPFEADAALPSQAMPAPAAQRIQDYLQTGNESLWFTTGQNSALAGDGLAWYLGGTTSAWHGTPLAVAVLLEEADSRLAQTIGYNLLTAPTRGLLP